MNRTVSALALAGVLACAAPLAASAADAKAADVQGGSYVVEPNHTQVGFSVLHMGFSEYSGVFSNASGSLELDPKALKATKLDISVPVETVATTSDKLNEELRGDQWLDAQKFPAMTFHATKIAKTGADTADIIGDLTLHGVTRPVVLKARFVGAGVNPLDKAYTVGFDVTGTIKRSDFGVKTYVPLIGDEVTFHIAAAFEKKPS